MGAGLRNERNEAPSCDESWIGDADEDDAPILHIKDKNKFAKLNKVRISGRDGCTDFK